MMTGRAMLTTVLLIYLAAMVVGLVLAGLEG